MKEFLDTLTQTDHYSAEDVHIYAGDFNGHVADEIETHIIQEGHTLTPRVGDCHKRHTPSPSAAAPITNARLSSPRRGRFFLRMLNTTSFLILNGRFEAADNPIPYTLQRQDEATTVHSAVTALLHKVEHLTNRMIQAAGLKFTKIFYEVFSMLWVHEIQPAA